MYSPSYSQESTGPGKAPHKRHRHGPFLVRGSPGVGHGGMGHGGMGHGWKLSRHTRHPESLLMVPKLESDLRIYSLQSFKCESMIPRTIDDRQKPKTDGNLNIIGFKQFITNYSI